MAQRVDQRRERGGREDQPDEERRDDKHPPIIIVGARKEHESSSVAELDGQVVGYTWAGGPPAGLVALAPPFATSFTTGAFPMLSWRGRATLSVSPMPALNLVARSGLPISEIDTPLGPGYVVEAPDGGVLDLLVPLPDGTTLEVAPVAATPEQAVDMLSLQELLTLVGSVRLVTETEWIEAYDPMLPVVPSSVPLVVTFSVTVHGYFAANASSASCVFAAPSSAAMAAKPTTNLSLPAS